MKTLGFRPGAAASMAREPVAEYEVARQSSADSVLLAAMRQHRVSAPRAATRTGSRVAQRRPEAACP